MGFFSGILGNAFGSVASSIGGVLGSVANIAGPLVGGILSNKSQSEANDLNYQLAQAQLQFQQEYAKNRLQWQVEDAKKAGLHPMVAAGLSPTSFSPVSAGQSGLNYDWVGEIGQNLDYAATKAKTTRQQAQAFAFTKASNELTLESLKLDNDIKRMEIMSMASRLSNSGPSAPPSGKSGAVIDGQGDSASPDNSFSAGTNPLLSLARVGNTLMAHINPDVSDSITEDFVRNQLANLNAEFQAGRLTPEVARHLSNNEKRMLARGEAELVYTPPSTWRILLTPKMRPKYSNGGEEVSGKMNFSKLSY